MNTKQKPKASPTVEDPRKLVEAALNEHGFLLQQVVRRKLPELAGDDVPLQGRWQFVAAEYPVTAADQSQTRIDLLLKHAGIEHVYICMECKRPNPKFKKWIFFDRESGIQGVPEPVLFVETCHIAKQPAYGEDVRHRLVRIPNLKVPVFSYYLEAAVKKDGSASSTEAIEKAFYQLMKGHSGLVAKFVASGDSGLFRSIPVVVTTAELFEAKFDSKKVDMKMGMVQATDLTLAPLDYCAVNYRADDSLALRNLTPHERRLGINDLMNAQIRTVFVVRVPALNDFLREASPYLISAQ